MFIVDEYFITALAINFLFTSLWGLAIWGVTTFFFLKKPLFTPFIGTPLFYFLATFVGKSKIILKNKYVLSLLARIQRSLEIYLFYKTMKRILDPFHLKIFLFRLSLLRF